MYFQSGFESFLDENNEQEFSDLEDLKEMLD